METHKPHQNAVSSVRRLPDESVPHQTSTSHEQHALVGSHVFEVDNVGNRPKYAAKLEGLGVIRLDLLCALMKRLSLQ